MSLFKDRLLKAYRWYIAIADNENMKADIRMEARLNAIDLSLALVKLEIEGAFALFKVEREGPRVIEKGRSA